MYNYILVVDDDILLAYAIQAYISSKSRKIFVVDNSTAAIKLLKLYNFDLVISDILMPKYSGYDLLLYIRLNSKLDAMPFIFLTAKGLTCDRIKGYDLGCSIYLTKPFHPAELQSIVNNLLFALVSSRQKSSFVFNNKVVKPTFDVTNREYSILNLLVQGYTNKEIARALSLSIRNVEKYVSRLLSKTKTRNRTELAQAISLKLMRANDGTRTRE